MWTILLSLIPLALAGNICTDRIITSSKMVQVTPGVHFNQSTFECASARLHKQFQPLTDAEESLIKRNAEIQVDKRQNVCTLPVPNCICGVACTGTECFAPRGPITVADCAALGLALIQSTGTFTIRPGQGEEFNIPGKTCTYGVFNNEATNLQEYCYNTLGNVGFGNLNGNCPNDEALCGGGTILGISRFFVEQLSSSFA